jgi:two-component system LytT family sensor kinase
LRAAAARRVQAHDEVASLLTDVCELLGPALSARQVAWREWAGTEGDEPSTLVTAGPEALVLVPTSEDPRYAIAISDVTGGRRFLSDDLATLDAIVVLAARRIDAIRITNERYDREIREQEIGKLATEAELRALRAQVNPHFLFNALTTIGHLIQTAPPRALETLMRLTALLRAVLRSEGEFTTLGRELEVVEAYLDIERARFEQRLRVRIDVPPGLAGLRVPPLVLQALVENAVKHGISTQRLGGEVTVTARVDRSTSHPPHLVLIVQNTGAGATADAFRRGRVAGVGLNNVERRLACHYGTAASLAIQSDPETGTTVELRLPIERAAPVEPALQGVGR